MDDEKILRYLELANRRAFIVLHSGIDWKPEYGPELEAIDRELETLRGLIDREHEKRMGGVEMHEIYEGAFIPKECCVFEGEEVVGEKLPCGGGCDRVCEGCVIQGVFNDYARISGQEKKPKEAGDLISRKGLMDALRGNVLIDVTPEMEEVVERQPSISGIGKAIKKIGEATDVAYERYIGCDSSTPAVEYAICGTQYIERRKALETIKSCIDEGGGGGC